MPFHPAMTNGVPWTSSLLHPGRPINPKANIPAAPVYVHAPSWENHRPRVIATLPPYPPLQITEGESRHPPNWTRLYGYSK